MRKRSRGREQNLTQCDTHINKWEDTAAANKSLCQAKVASGTKGLETRFMSQKGKERREIS